MLVCDWRKHTKHASLLATVRKDKLLLGQTRSVAVHVCHEQRHCVGFSRGIGLWCDYHHHHPITVRQMSPLPPSPHHHQTTLTHRHVWRLS